MTKNIQTKSAPSIVVVGMGCVYPGAHCPEIFWKNILAGRRFFRKAPPERLPADYFDPDPSTPDKSYCDKMAVITNWVFDSSRFRIAPNTVRCSDITHWLALHTADQAVRNSAIDFDRVDRSRVGVILGNSLAGEFQRSHYLRGRWPYMKRGIKRAMGYVDDLTLSRIKAELIGHLPEFTEDSLAGNMSNTITGRICNHFDFGGGAFTVDGACSSSLLSVAIACNALIDGEMDLALTGGVDISLDPFEIVGFAKAMALAKDDIRPFDKSANGMITGEGCGIVILAREDQALANGWNILARIKGWGYSTDGKGIIVAPSKEGQKRVLEKAYQRAGYPLSSVGYIEAHGTGTALGDVVELSAITSLLTDDETPGPCRIGSIKANIGHCKAAAGIAGLIKSIMALQHAIIPPTVNCDNPNDEFGKSHGRLEPSGFGRPWVKNENPRRASVSAMGFGGANSHITLEEVLPVEAPSEEDVNILGSHQKTELVILSAPTPTELLEKVNHLISISEKLSMAELTDLSAAVCKKPPQGCYRLAVVSESPWHLTKALKKVQVDLKAGHTLEICDLPEKGIFAGETCETPRIAGIFPGQASHYINMGQEYFRRYPFVRDLYTETDQQVRGILGQGLTTAIFPDKVILSQSQSQSFEKNLRDTRMAQPAITLTSIGILSVLNRLGLTPDITLGHSLGELSALHAAGVMDARTTVLMAAMRGQAMGGLALADNGAMAALEAPADKVRELLVAATTQNIVISNYNSPNQTVVSGPTQEVVLLVEKAKAYQIQAIQLKVSHAFHSPIVSPAADVFKQKISKLSLNAPSGICMSTVTGGVVPQSIDLHDHFAKAIKNPVDFIKAVESADAHHPTLWIEIGPGSILSSFIRRILPSASSNVFTTAAKGMDAHTQINRIVARVFVQGGLVQTARLFDHRYHNSAFDPEDHHPIFITNPCEQPVKMSTDLPASDFRPIQSEFLPFDKNDPEFLHYLNERGDFIRSMIQLDYGHYTQNQPRATEALLAADRKPYLTEAKSAETKQKSTDPMAFAIEWISNRTGYSPTSITPDMRLYDDLNLDSIKVGEMVLAIALKLDSPVDKDLGMFANASIKEVVARLEKDAGKQRGSDGEGKAALDFREMPGLPKWTRTFALSSLPAPLAAESETFLPKTGHAYVIDGEPPFNTAIQQRLIQSGLKAECISLASLIALEDVPADIAVLVYVPPLMTTPLISLAADEAYARTEGIADDVFRLFKWIVIQGNPKPDSLTSDGWDLRCLVVRQAGEDADHARDMDAGAALLKTLTFEYPLTDDAVLKWVTLPLAWDVEKRADTVMGELGHTSQQVAFRYLSSGERVIETIGPLPTDNSSKPPVFNERDVFIVSGGAKGVTCELALGLARQTGATMALIGSSPLNTDDSPEKNEIVRNLKRFAENGIRAEYFQADVTDKAAVSNVVERVEEILGTVTGILHGAGVTKPQKFHIMDRDSFLKCVRIKTVGCYNILKAVDVTRIKAVHFVSSILGRTGMGGQVDYTLANAWLDGTAQSLQGLLPQAHIMSIGYSLWRETGVGHKLGNFNYLEKMGVETIDTEDGVRAYVDQVARPSGAAVCSVTGRLPDSIETHLYGSNKIVGRPRFLERILHKVPVVELIAEADLTHHSDPFLSEHVFGGTSIFPGVMAVEAMAQAAMACIGTDDLPAFYRIQFLRPLIVPPEVSVTMRLIAVAGEPSNESGETVVQVEIRSATDRFQAPHFTAECRFGVNETVKPAAPMGKPPEVMNLDISSFSPSPLFQGELFRCIEAIRVLDSEKQSITDIRVPSNEKYYRDEAWDRPLFGNPAVHDSLLQSGALLFPHGYLPVSIRELIITGPINSNERLYCQAVSLSWREDGFLADITAYNESGSPVCVMRKVDVRRVAVQAQGNEKKHKPSIMSPAQSETVTDSLMPDTYKMFSQIEKDMVATLRELQQRVLEKDLKEDDGRYLADIQSVFDSTLERLEPAAVAVHTPSELSAIRKSVQTCLQPFLDQEGPFARCLNKPLNYPGDYLLMVQIYEKHFSDRGIENLIDRCFVEAPGCEAIRQRSYWVRDKLTALSREYPDRPLTILDVGCGPMNIERELAKTENATKRFHFTGVDFEPNALAYATERMRACGFIPDMHVCNMLSPNGLKTLGGLCRNVDVVISMGMVEYFEDYTAALVFESIFNNLKSGGKFFYANYVPDHPSQKPMEWYLDWWLVYRSEEKLVELLAAAGFQKSDIAVCLDPSGCIALVEAKKA